VSQATNAPGEVFWGALVLFMTLAKPELDLEHSRRDSRSRPLRPSRELDRVHHSASPQAWLAWIPAAVLLTLVLRSAWVADDAYITLRSVENWLNGFGLRWNTGERVQAFTHPLWMLALTLVYTLVRQGFIATVLLGLITTCAGLLLLRRLARSPVHAAVVFLLLAASRTFIDFSTSGLENPLSHLLVGTFIYCYVERREGVLRLAALSALIALNRSDALLFVIPALAHTCWLGWRDLGIRKTGLSLLLGFSPLLAWEVISLVYYGSLVPNTAYAKLNTGVSGFELTAQGAVYVRDMLAWDPPLLPIVGLGIALALGSRQLRPSLIAIGVTLYLLYVVRIGGDFMMGRFFTLPLFTACCLLARAELPLEQPASLGLVFGALALLFLHPNATERWPIGAMQHDGVADERAYYRDTSSFMMWTRTRNIPSHYWVADGHRAKINAKRVELSGNVGYLGFAAGPSVHIVDKHALTDPLLARLPARADPFWRIGHYEREVPKGYLATLESGKCKLDDRDLCKYYERLHEVVAGDLWSWSRLRTIVALNLGHYDHLIDFERYRYPGRLVIDYEELQGAVAEDAAYNSKGMRLMPNSGALVRMDAVSHVKQVAVSLDGNDAYAIEFRRDKEMLGELRSASLHVTGAHTREIDVPEAAAKRGFNRIFIRPLNGDNAYSLGFLRLYL
jgi:arabinofuranosyltransferase